MKYILVAYSGADDSVSVCKRIENLTDGTAVAAVVSTRMTEALLASVDNGFTTEQAAKRMLKEV